MPQYNQINETRNQLATPMVTGGSGMQALNTMTAPTGTDLVPEQQPKLRKLRTGKNPNPKFPVARHVWEVYKDEFGKMFDAGNYQGIIDKLNEVASGAKELAIGKPGGVEQHQTVTPEEQKVLKFLQDMGMKNFENPYEGFEPIQEQAESGFKRDISNLAHRFTSLGSAGLDSPDFTASAGGAASDFRTNLAAQRAQWGQQNNQSALQQLQLGLGKQIENVYRPQQTGLIHDFIKAIPAFAAML